jgi:hypothetical protein
MNNDTDVAVLEQADMNETGTWSWSKNEPINN